MLESLTLNVVDVKHCQNLRSFPTYHSVFSTELNCLYFVYKPILPSFSSSCKIHSYLCCYMFCTAHPCCLCSITLQNQTGFCSVIIVLNLDIFMYTPVFIFSLIFISNVSLSRIYLSRSLIVLSFCVIV